jgi:hypothetical protein
MVEQEDDRSQSMPTSIYELEVATIERLDSAAKQTTTSRRTCPPQPNRQPDKAIWDKVEQYEEDSEFSLTR